MRILIVEDEPKLVSILTQGLKAEGFAVDAATDGRQGLEMAHAYPYDAIVLDLMLPVMNGGEVLAAIRAKNRHVPILILTASDALADKVKHLDDGADDYLTKPFAFAELVVRIKALLRRAPEQRNDVLRIGDLEIDRLSRQVRRGGRKIELSAKEFGLLEYLAQHTGRVLTRSMIIEHVWDQSFEGLTNIVDVYIRQLRAKIDDGENKKLIQTVRGMGYRLTDEGAA